MDNMGGSDLHTLPFHVGTLVFRRKGRDLVRDWPKPKFQPIREKATPLSSGILISQLGQCGTIEEEVQLLQPAIR